MSGDAGTVDRERRVWRPRLLAISTLLLVAAGLALGSPRTSASPGWELILDLPGTDFQGIDFVSESEGWLATGAGLLHTTDGGVTWQEAAPIPGQHVDFADPTHGWLVGYSGSIYATSDGVTWSRQESGTKVHLTDVFAVSPQEAWVVGVGEGFSDVVAQPPPGVFLHTIDGGATWQQVETPATSWFREITFVGQKGWAVGDYCAPRTDPDYDPAYYCGSPTTAALLHTENGGATWALLETNLTGDRSRHLVFVDENKGWVAQSIPGQGRARDALFSTSDGGTNWQQLDVGPVVRVEAMTFRDELEGWALVAACDGVPIQDPCPMVLLSTFDGGERWTGLLIDIRQDYTFELLATEEALFLTGPGDQIAGVALRSTNGGAGWQPMAHPGLDLREIAFADAEVGFALSHNGFARASTMDLYRTDDAGKSWQRVGPTPVSWTGSLNFLDARHGFVAGSDCSVGRCALTIHATNDGGESWEPLYAGSPGSGTSAVAFQFVDVDHGWFVSQRDFLMTQDGGRTWTQPHLPFDQDFTRGADLADKDRAWAVISMPEKLVRSLDGGRTWQIAPGTSGVGRRPMGQVDFIDRNHGWYSAQVCEVTSCTIILRATHDGGETWEDIDFGGERSFIEELAFADRLNGWLIGGTCEEQCTVEVLRTADGGRTWVSQLTTQRFPLNLTFADAETAWVWFPSFRPVGLGGELPARMQIYHTTDGGGGPSSIVPPDTGSASPPSGAAFPLPLVLTLAALGWSLLAAAALGRGQRRRS